MKILRNKMQIVLTNKGSNAIIILTKQLNERGIFLKKKTFLKTKFSISSKKNQNLFLTRKEIKRKRNYPKREKKFQK